MTIIDILKKDKDILLYRKEFNKITGSVTASILLQQIIYRLDGKDEFYKFKMPCNHDCYKEGDSWCEELGFSEREFEGAIKILKSKGFVKTRITIDRVTFYTIDEGTLGKALNVLYEKDETSSTKRTKCPLDISIIFEDPETTSENNTEPPYGAKAPIPQEGRESGKTNSEMNSNFKQEQIPYEKLSFEQKLEGIKQTCTKAEWEAGRQVTCGIPAFITKWDEWEQHRKEKRQKLTPSTKAKQIKQLTAWHGQGHNADEIIEQSIMNGWTGLFVVKSEKQKGGYKTKGEKIVDAINERAEFWKEQYKNNRTEAIDCEVSDV